MRDFPQLAIVADVELHNREELLSSLAPELQGTPLAGDSHLLLAAYAKWGVDCASFLLGEFAFAIWDARLRRLYCCCDQIGFRSFFYWQGKASFVFAGDIDCLLQFPSVPRELNRRKFAGLDVPSGQHLYRQETFHAGIAALPAGAWMTIEGDRIQRHTYWEPRGGKWVPRKPADAYEALRETLFQAVECRVSEAYPAVALLSGGLDSSAVVSIAARCLERRNRSLTAVSAVLPEGSGPIADERPYISEFKSWPNVRIEYVTAPGRGPFDSLDNPGRFTASPLLPSNFYLADECVTTAFHCGARALLGGEGGEYGPTCWGDRYLVDLAMRLRWTTLMREMRSVGALHKVFPLRVLAGQFRNILFPRRRLAPSVLLAPDFKRQWPAKVAFRSRWPYQKPHEVALLRHRLGKQAVPARALAGGLMWRSYPLLDKRVLELCLSLPPDLNVQGGYQRCLIRKSLDGILPKRIQWRTGKCPFSPDYFVRYNAQLGMAKEFVASIRAKDPVRSVVDVEHLGKLLEPVDPKAGKPGAVAEIPSTIYAINFLRQFAEFQP
ncbi:MAG: asparagine synthase-related protein [Bryobacteraceae bacterium]